MGGKGGKPPTGAPDAQRGFQMLSLVVNAGSSSVKAAVFDGALSTIATGSVREIGARAEIEAPGGEGPVEARDHAAALALLIAAFGGLSPIGMVAHRVVHGGARFAAPCRITPEVIAGIEAVSPIAPLHNPANLAGIRAVAGLAPDIPQYASFDTAFHATNPEVALRYALPPEAEALGLRRYGFHGLSYASLVANWQGALPKRLLAYHLGNGASACAILEGRSVASSMGYSPLDGLTMGTRTGGIDGNAVLRLAEVYGIEGAARILNRESGLKGLSGMSDMRAMLRAGTPDADFARAHFAYWAVRHGGSLIAAMGGLDGVAFTGGIGEHDDGMRGMILDGLAYAGVRHLGGIATGHVVVRMVEAAEERQIAAEALALHAGEGR